MNRWAHGLVLVGVVAGLGCTGTIGEKAPDPFREDIGSASAELRQNVLERRAIFMANELASDVFEDAVNSHLIGLGIAVRYIETPMTPDASREASAEWMDGSAGTGVDPTVPAGEPSTCPWAQPSPALDPSATSCRYVAGEVARRAQTRAVQRFSETPITGEFVEDAPRPEEVVEWYGAAFDFGMAWSPDVLVGALRNAGACDTAPTPAESSYEIGVRAGRQSMAEQVRAAEASAPRDRCDTDFTIMEPARASAMAAIDATVAANELCVGYVAPGPTERNRLLAAMQSLRDGVAAGIEEQAREESARLVREFVCTPPAPPGGGGDGGGSGDPLVLDLNGDGIHIEEISYGAEFDFGDTGRVRTQWLFGDGFVVLDRNRDREIVSTELFGDVTVTEDGARAADGLQALALYDRSERGGNGDGRIDENDRVYRALEIWTDRDGDAQADRGELRSLRSAGVAAIDITRERWIDDSGNAHGAADVWFEYVR